MTSRLFSKSSQLPDAAYMTNSSVTLTGSEQATTITERHITTSTNCPPQTPQQTHTHTHTHTVLEPLLKLAEEPVEDVAGQRD